MSLLAERTLASGQVVAVHQGDLTEAAVDAIVNAANEHLRHSGGLAGAIVRRGGPDVQRESDAWVKANGPAAHDRPALTTGGRLRCRAIIHAVGPVWGSGGEVSKLGLAYGSSLVLAHQHGFRSIAFPSISTGIFGFPVEIAAPVAVAAVIEFCSQNPDSPVREVRFVIIDAPTVDVFRRALERHGATRLNRS